MVFDHFRRIGADDLFALQHTKCFAADAAGVSPGSSVGDVAGDFGPDRIYGRRNVDGLDAAPEKGAIRQIRKKK